MKKSTPGYGTKKRITLRGKNSSAAKKKEKEGGRCGVEIRRGENQEKALNKKNYRNRGGSR